MARLGAIWEALLAVLGRRGPSKARTPKSLRKNQKKIAIFGLLRLSVGPVGALLGRLRALWSRLGALLGRLGALLGALGTLLDGLGTSWSALGAVCGPSWGPREAPFGAPGPSWGSGEAPFRAPGPPKPQKRPPSQKRLVRCPAPSGTRRCLHCKRDDVGLQHRLLHLAKQRQSALPLLAILARADPSIVADDVGFQFCLPHIAQQRQGPPPLLALLARADPSIVTD